MLRTIQLDSTPNILNNYTVEVVFFSLRVHVQCIRFGPEISR